MVLASELQKNREKDLFTEITPDQVAAPKFEIENNAPAGRTFSIYQLKNNESTRPFKFEGLDYVKQHNENAAPSLEMYDLVYSGSLPEGKGLDDIFTEFNINHPADFTGHSLSVSDIIAIKFEGEITAHYVDRFGFENLPEFAQAIEDKQQELNVASYDKCHGVSEDSRRHEETLDSVKFDNDIDFDREKTRDQLGFKDQAAAPAQPQKK